MKGTATKAVGFQKLEDLLKRGNIQDAFTPNIMEEIFHEKKKLSVKEPTIFTEERFKELHENGIGVIVFVPKTAKRVVNLFGNKKEGGDLIHDIEHNTLPRSPFWQKEKPRSGLCLMSFDCIPKSNGETFFGQTLLLANYIEKVLPELKETAFWKASRIALQEAEPAARELTKKSAGIRGLDDTASGRAICSQAVSLLQKLEINRIFRPKFIEVLQQTIAYDRKNKINLHGYFSAVVTNSTDGRCQGLISLRTIHKERSVSMDRRYPVYGRDEFGCSFICSLDWLESVI